MEINQKLEEIYSMYSWQKTQVARHEDRPKAHYYIKKIFSQLHYYLEVDFGMTIINCRLWSNRK